MENIPFTTVAPEGVTQMPHIADHWDGPEQLLAALPPVAPEGRPHGLLLTRQQPPLLRPRAD